MREGLGGLSLLLSLLVVCVRLGEAQEAKVYRIGFLSPTPATILMEPFTLEFRDLGWVEGRHFRWEKRFTGAKPDSADALARELVDLQVDMIITVVTGNAVAARRASAHIPIVMVSSGYPVAAGLANSLGRPGGNVTGNATYVDGLFGKQLQFLRVLNPRVSRLGVLWDYVPPAVAEEENAFAFGELRQAARTLGVSVTVREVRSGTDVDHALAHFKRTRIDALFVTAGPVHAQAEPAGAITEFSRRRRLPTMSDFAGSFFFNQGGLMAYSANPATLGRRAAHFADRILRGADPKDLPIERPAKFDLVINGKTARALGLRLPPRLLQFADRVIE